jgi:L-alanine-DL-glutamate epimerase-like enolase superfamily enzyme
MKRRHFLMTSGLAVGATGAATAAQPARPVPARPEIRITDIKSFLVGLGRNHVPEKPGWGIELNEEAFRHYPPKPWRRGFGFRADGSVDFI